MRKVIVLLPLILLGMLANAQSVVDQKGSKRVADTTNDGWKNDAPNTQVKLAYNSDETTARPDSTAVVVKDNGRVGIGLIGPSGILDIRGKMYVNNQQTVYNAAALDNTNFAGSLFLGNGGQSLTSGATNNTGIGINALSANTGGTFNTATGFSSLITNTSGSRNTAGGIYALRFNTTGSDNTAGGAYSLQANTTGTNNVAIGTRALSANKDISNGVALGYESQGNVVIPTVSTTNFNTSVGYQSLKGSATPASNIGNGNTAIGYQSMTAYTTANNNVAVGFNAMKAAIDAVSNTALGYSSLEKVTSGSYNIAIGRSSLGNNTTSPYNIALGYNTGLDLTTAASGANTMIGYNTGRGIATGSNNTILGANVTGLAASLSNNIIIADGAGNRRINVDSIGNTGIGTNTPSAKLEVNGTVEITTVNSIPDDIAYKPLFWNTTTNRVESTDDNAAIKRLSTSIASTASANIGTALTASDFLGAAYEIKILVFNGCGAGAYDKFLATGSTAGYWRINFVAGLSENGPATAIVSNNGLNVAVTNPLSIGCFDGGNTTALNYRLNITNAGQLSITNNGNIARTYTFIIEKVMD